MWLCWLTLVLSLLVGGAAGYGTMKHSRVGVLLLGAWIGGIVGGVIYGILISNFSKENPLLALWLTILVCSILVAVLTQVYFDVAIIICSAIAGSYLFVRVSNYISLITFIRVFLNSQVDSPTNSQFTNSIKMTSQIKCLSYSTFISPS